MSYTDYYVLLIGLVAGFMLSVIGQATLRKVPLRPCLRLLIVHMEAKLAGQRGAVTSGVGICSRIDFDVIEKGGNAVDAVSLR